MHRVSEPAILYFGTPVVLISTLNENGTYNLAPMSSAFWLGWNCIIGLGASSKTTGNIIRTKQCVLNLPSVNEVAAVDRLALTTGSNPVPEKKQRRGYRFQPDKFEIANLTPQSSDEVDAPRVFECPVQLEAELKAVHPVAHPDALQRGGIVTMELKIIRVHLDESIIMDDDPDKIDSEKWRPLIMSFQKFYGLGEQLYPSTLSQIPEYLYRS
jgi:flavin reductase (DIM6/NTAB) family NADH-FMN oxidoreductase RutF